MLLVASSMFVPDSNQMVPPAATRACAAVMVLNGDACVPALPSDPFGPTQNSFPGLDVPPVPPLPRPTAPALPAVPVMPPRPAAPALPAVPAPPPPPADAPPLPAGALPPAP